MVADIERECLGSTEDQAFIRSYLSSLRKVTPHEMFLSDGALSLSEIIQAESLIDKEMFYRIVGKADAVLREEFHQDIILMARERYFLGCPKADDHFGGFHSPRAVGYQDMYQAAFSIQPNVKYIKSKIVRTLEVVRCYLHDSMHHSTFCSYKRVRRTPVSSRDAKHLLPSVYRYQYGINFRNALGQTYSSAELSYKSPYAVNVNLLMDGAIVLTVSDIMSRLVGSIERDGFSRLEKMMLDDIVLSSNYTKPNVWGEEFYYRVTQPVQKFMDYWGGDHIRRLVVQAMISGTLDPLTTYFDERFGEMGAWEKVFRQPGFRFDVD